RAAVDEQSDRAELDQLLAGADHEEAADQGGQGIPVAAACAQLLHGVEERVERGRQALPGEGGQDRQDAQKEGPGHQPFGLGVEAVGSIDQPQPQDPGQDGYDQRREAHGAILTRAQRRSSARSAGISGSGSSPSGTASSCAMPRLSLTATLIRRSGMMNRKLR